MTITLDAPLRYEEVVAVAEGARLELSSAARARIVRGRAIVDALIAGDILTYGLNTGVGALSNVVIDGDKRRQLSRNILLSHAVGVGAPLGRAETRAIMVALANNLAHGPSGVRPDVVEQLLALLAAGCTPVVPGQGSVGYLAHTAQISLVLIGEGEALLGGERLTGAEALRRCGLEPLVLEAKEGLSLVNGSPCATGLAALALGRGRALLDWADAIAALSFEALGGQAEAFDEEAMALHRSPGLNAVAARLRERLASSPRLHAAAGARTQDALSLRAIPHVHGAAHDAFDFAAAAIDRELASATDNPVVLGSPESPRVRMEAHAVAPGVGMAMDLLGIALAQVAAMAERRIDRLINPLVNGLTPFLTSEDGVQSGFMIAQYTAQALVGENRRLAAPASLDGGVTSGLQEDHLAHATPAGLKALKIADAMGQILAIEYLCAAQASDLGPALGRAAGTEVLHARLRAKVPFYADDRPLGADLALAKAFIMSEAP